MRTAMDKDKSLGQRLKVLREQNGYSQQQVADYLHIIRQTYSHYENGRIIPPMKNIYALARFYDIDSKVLIGTESTNSITADKNELTSQETYLLYCFRKLDERDKRSITMLAEIMNRQNDLE